MKVIIIGPYPPPYGGISVHIKRIKLYLENNNTDVYIYNDSKKFIFKIPFLKADIFHFHSIGKLMRILIGFSKKSNKKFILTIHGESLHEQISTSNFFSRKFLIYSLKKLDKIICVNPKTIDELIKLGFDENKIVCIPTYINPIEDKDDFNKIPSKVWSFIRSSKFLICANGCIKFNNNEDLYGIDILIDLMYMLKKSENEVSLIISLLDKGFQNKEEKKYYEQLKNRIDLLNLNEYILIYEVKDTEFYPILKESKLFLRPTNTDGYGNSIAEAIYYKVPSIASDVCKRPKGTILFKSRDIDDLYRKTTDVIENYEFYIYKLNSIEVNDNSKMLFDIYDDLNTGGDSFGNK